VRKSKPRSVASSLNPGSVEAVSAGCTCPILDNEHGKGYHMVPGVFVVTMGCPIHPYHGNTDARHHDTADAQRSRKKASDTMRRYLNLQGMVEREERRIEKYRSQMDHLWLQLTIAEHEYLDSLRSRKGGA